MTRGQLRNPALQHPFRGVRAAPGVEVRLLERCAAFAASSPRAQVFSHVTAALLHGMPLPERFDNAPLHVMSPASARSTKATGTVGHSASFTSLEVVAVRGIPVTTVERTWCDLAAILGFADLVAAGDSLLWHENPATTIERLRDAVTRYPSQRGRRRMRAALNSLSDHSRSRPESLLRLAIVASPLPDPVPNHAVFLPLSGKRIEIDLAFPDYKVGLEYQGDHHRTDRRQWRSDVRRGNDAVDENWSMIYVTGDDLGNFDDVIARTERRLRARGWNGKRAVSPKQR
jgi:hypothetical protein